RSLWNWTVALADPLLFDGSGSRLDDETVAVFRNGLAPPYVGETANVVVMTACWPGARVPRLHGNAVVQAPALETNVRPAGAGSSTWTPVAVSGPRLATVRVAVMSVPAVATAGPTVTTWRSPPDRSKDPMSQRAPTGRVTPRWSVASGQVPTTASMAG